MYAFFFDKSAQDSQALMGFVSDWKLAKNIVGEDHIISTVDDITTICKKNGHKYSSLVADGSEKTFDYLVSQASNFKGDAVLAYIPTSADMLAKRIGVKDYKEACEVISQRKIVELTALSFNQNYFLFGLSMRVNNSDDNDKILVSLDKSMQLSLVADKIVVHNRNQELLPHNTGLLLEAFTLPKKQDEKRNLLQIATTKLVNSKQNAMKLQLRMPANSLALETKAEIFDSYSHPIKLPLKIGLSKKPVRLIVKKGQELQAIMSPGLIS